MTKQLRYFLTVGMVLSLLSCGGGGGSKKDNADENAPDGDQAEEETADGNETPVSDTGSIPEGPIGTDGGIEPSAATSPDQLKKLSVTIKIPDGEIPEEVTRSISRASIASQVSRVYIEVLIGDVLFSTTDLTRDPNSSLFYRGEITIPVNVELTLHAVATAGDGSTLFEGTTTNVIAADFESPAIQLVLERKVPVEATPPANSAPFIKSVLVADRSAAYGQSVALSVDAEDPQDDLITYRWEVTQAPDAVDRSGLMSQADQQGAVFTAPSVDGTYTISVTASDPSGASASQSIVVNVSETGLDDTPAVQVMLSDFPDCVRISNSACIPAGGVVVRATNSSPNPRSLGTEFLYNLDDDSSYEEYYTANEMFAAGFTFEWSDTCNGSNFLVLDPDTNHTLVETTTQFVPSFVRSGPDAESCQITLTLRNREGMSENYTVVQNMGDLRFNRSQELNCDSTPANLYPKVSITCPDMTEVPGRIEVTACDAQGDLSYVVTDYWISTDWNTGESIHTGLWSWYLTTDGEERYGALATNSGSRAALSGSDDTAEYLVYPYSQSLTAAQLVATGADNYINTGLQAANVVEPVGMAVEFKVFDLFGRSATASCFFGIATDIDLTPVIP